MRRKSKIEDTLSRLFKNPMEGRHAAAPVEPPAASEGATPPAAAPAQAARRSASPLRVDSPGAFTLANLDEVPVTPPFEKNASAPQPSQPAAQEAPPEAPALDPQERLRAWHDHQLVTCLMNGALYALRIDNVEAILNMQPITSLPASKAGLAGITNWRGVVLPVINLRHSLGLKTLPEAAPARHILVVNAQGLTAGLVVDQVSAVLALPNAAFEPLPGVSAGSPFIDGVARQGERLILLIDLPRLLAQFV